MSDKQEIISSGSPHEVHLAEGSKTAVHKTATPMEPQIRNTAANLDETVELIEVVKGVTHNQAEEERLAKLAQAGSKIEKTRESQQAEGTTETDRMAHAESTDSKDRFAQAPENQDPAARIAQADDATEHAEHRVDEDRGQTPNIAHITALPLDQVLSDLPSLDLPASEASVEVAEELPSAALVAVSEPMPPAPQEAATQADTSETDTVAVMAQQQHMAEMNFPARVVKLKMANDQMRGQIEKLEKPLLPPIPVEAPAPAKSKEKAPAKKPAKGH